MVKCDKQKQSQAHFTLRPIILGYNESECLTHDKRRDK